MEGVYPREKAEDLPSMLVCSIPLQKFQVPKQHPASFGVCGVLWTETQHELVTTDF